MGKKHKDAPLQQINALKKSDNLVLNYLFPILAVEKINMSY